jgi:hypothetical protein
MSFSILLTLAMNIIKGYLVKIAKCKNVKHKIKYLNVIKKIPENIYSIDIL